MINVWILIICVNGACQPMPAEYPTESYCQAVGSKTFERIGTVEIIKDNASFHCVKVGG